MMLQTKISLSPGIQNPRTTDWFPQKPRLFFFNPVSRRRIDLPFPYPPCSAAAFSAPPTSPHCTVIAIQRDNNLSIDQFNVHVLKLDNHNNTWTRLANNSVASTAFGTVMQTVYSNGIFNLMDLEGRISSFDIKQGSLEVISVKQFDCDGGSYLVEFNGEIFGVLGSIERVYGVIRLVIMGRILQRGKRGLIWKI